MTQHAASLTVNEGQVFWVMWAAFKAVEQDPTQALNYDSALRAFLPAMSNYDFVTFVPTFVPLIDSLLKRRLKLGIAERNVLEMMKSRLVTEAGRRGMKLEGLDV